MYREKPPERITGSRKRTSLDQSIAFKIPTIVVLSRLISLIAYSCDFFRSGPVQFDEAVRWMLADYGGKDLCEKGEFCVFFFDRTYGERQLIMSLCSIKTLQYSAITTHS